MVSGMGTISGAIVVVYAAMGVPAEHLLASCVMSVPATIVIAKILYPETERSKTDVATVEYNQAAATSNVFDAIAGGTSDGLRLALNVAAMLIAFLSLLGLLNYVLAAGAYYLNSVLAALGSHWFVPADISLQLIFSYLLEPVGYLFGFTGSEARAAGELIGIKVAVNELIAYGKMVTMPLSERATAILTYALCGFSNFSCIGIQIGGIGALVPERRSWLTELGMYAVLGGTLSNIMTAMIAGLLL
jgi:CNT family concentrative nucleoside transporter